MSSFNFVLDSTLLGFVQFFYHATNLLKFSNQAFMSGRCFRRWPPTREAQPVMHYCRVGAGQCLRMGFVFAKVRLACKALFNLASQAAKGRRGVCEVGPGPGPTSQALLTIWDPLPLCAGRWASAYICTCIRPCVRVRAYVRTRACGERCCKLGVIRLVF